MGRGRFACCVLVLACLFVLGCGGYDPSHIVAIEDARYAWVDDGAAPTESEWQPLPPNAWRTLPAGRGAKRELHIRFRVPPAVADDPALFVGDDSRVLSASIDGRVLVPATSMPFVLPYTKDVVGKDAEVMFRGTWSTPLGELRAGSQRALMIRMQRLESVAFCSGVVLVFLALLMILAALVRRRREYVWLGVFSLLLGSLGIAQATAWSLVMWPDARVWTLVRAIGMTLVAMPMARFIAAVFGEDRHRSLTRLSALQVVAATGCFALDLAGVYPIAMSRRIGYLFDLVITVLGGRQLVRAARGGDGGARLFFMGIGALLFFAAPDFVWGLGYRLLPLPLVSTGGVAFVVFLAAVVERRFHEQRQSLEVRNKELDVANEELRSQVERRSRELRELLSGLPPTSGRGSLPPGEVVDERYRVVRPLGAGAMGAVYEVERTTDRQRFALKVMLAAKGSTDAARFMREAEIAAKLRHRNIVRTVDVGYTSEGVLYIVMDLVRGSALDRALLAPHDDAWKERILLDVARGLAAVHEAGVVHRDLKPGNVLVDDDSGDARIADLGIARPEDALAKTVEKDKGSLTATGALMGTPLYMAPEVARGGRATAACDVFAFGLVAIEVMTGRYPFEVPPALTAIMKQPLRAPDLSALPEPLRELLSTCIADDPQARPTAAQIAERLAGPGNDLPA